MPGESETPPTRKSSTMTRTWKQLRYNTSHPMSRSKEIRTPADAKRNPREYTRKERLDIVGQLRGDLRA